MADPTIFMLATFTVTDRDAFDQAVDEAIELVNDEPGTLSYEWYLDGDTCHLVESYTDSAAAYAHLTGPVIGALTKAVGAAEFGGLYVYGPASDDVKDGVSALGATVFGEPAKGKLASA